MSSVGDQVEAFLMNPTFTSKGGFRIIINGVTIYKVFQDHQDFDSLSYRSTAHWNPNGTPNSLDFR